MNQFKVIAVSIIVSTIFGAVSGLAQAQGQPLGQGPGQPLGQPMINNGPVLSAPVATQVKRCQDFGRYVNLVASARDANESQSHLIDRLGLNLHSEAGMYQGRLPRNTRAAGGTALVQKIYARNASPADWQTAMQGVCEREIVS
ncbi:MAG: hypothetical protein ABI128_04175 [Rhodanobacter sp.]